MFVVATKKGKGKTRAYHSHGEVVLGLIGAHQPEEISVEQRKKYDKIMKLNTRSRGESRVMRKSSNHACDLV